MYCTGNTFHLSKEKKRVNTFQTKRQVWRFVTQKKKKLKTKTKIKNNTWGHEGFEKEKYCNCLKLFIYFLHTRQCLLNWISQILFIAKFKFIFARAPSDKIDKIRNYWRLKRDRVNIKILNFYKRHKTDRLLLIHSLKLFLFRHTA